MLSYCKQMEMQSAA